VKQRRACSAELRKKQITLPIASVRASAVNHLGVNNEEVAGQQGGTDGPGFVRHPRS
jgi:hypothetical protein